MNADERKKPAARVSKARVDAQRAEAIRLRSEGLNVVAVSEMLGVSPQRAGQLLKPVPPNHCRACGRPVERPKRYHTLCRPSRREPTGRASGPPPMALPKRRYGRWTVLGCEGEGKWLCRCRCGVEKAVSGGTLKTGKSTQCRSCAAKTRWANDRNARKVRKEKPSG